MKIGVLTSSRADFGIYLPLLKVLEADPYFDLRLLVFGTHLSPYHGYTLNLIDKEGFIIDQKISSLLAADEAEAVSSGMALTMEKFSAVWKNEQYDLVLALGDRFEMFAAVAAAVPFNIPVAHIHAGEVTEGAIDNQFRDSISIFSTLYFTATEQYASRVRQLKANARVYHVGALSLDNLLQMPLYTVEEFKSTFNIDLKLPSILITVHPETINYKLNQQHIHELLAAIDEIKGYQFIVTMPNADTYGSVIRAAFQKYASQVSNMVLIENFGTRGYFSCMKYCSFLLGNTSSGILEAASFNKFVINIGDRQKGRLCSANVYHVPFEKGSILNAVNDISVAGDYTGQNIYWKGGASKEIVQILKEL